MVISLLSSMALAYECLRFPAMKKLQKYSVDDLPEHAKYFASCRFIKTESFKTVFWRNLFFRLAAHTFGLIVVTGAFLFILAPNVLGQFFQLF